MAQTVARLLAESLEAHDVGQVYCVPGESYVGLTSALIERNSIRVIVCRHEGGAGYMAVADGRLRDRAGVAIVSRGPGLSNAMVSLHSAYHAFGAEGITLRSEADVADSIAQAFAVKTKPVVVHCLTSAMQMSAWRRYTRSEALP
jgi:thiamine pyrophosphate-dependent acetolactate synthase large subunit-like protein